VIEIGENLANVIGIVIGSAATVAIFWILFGRDDA
jgi:hypothetical protein